MIWNNVGSLFLQRFKSALLLDMQIWIVIASLTASPHLLHPPNPPPSYCLVQSATLCGFLKAYTGQDSVDSREMAFV